MRIRTYNAVQATAHRPAGIWPGSSPATEVLRSLKRRISNAIYARLLPDARQAAAASAAGPGGQPGNDSDSSAAGLHPGHRLFGQATPGPGTTLRPATRRKPALPSKPSPKNTQQSP